MVHAIAFTQEPAARKKADPALLAFLSKRFSEEKATIPQNLTKEEKAYVHEVYESRYKMECDLVNDGDLLIDSPIQLVLDSILESIQQHNNIHKSHRIFLNSDLSANAFATGDGNIFVNIGLLFRLHSIEELTFVICHEISHDLQEHLRIQTLQKAAFVSSDQFKADIKKIENTEFGQRTLYEKIIGSALSKSRRFSRANEFEADSIGLRLFLSMGHSAESAISLLNTLETVDQELEYPVVDFESIFSIPNFSPDKDWFEEEESSFGQFKYRAPELADSLRTHPEIPIRISHLVGENGNAAPVESMKCSENYQWIKELSERECVYEWFLLGNLGKAFYYACRLDTKKSTPYSQCMIALCLADLVQAKRRRELGYHLSLNSSGYSANYNQCLTILNEMSASEMINFTKAYLDNKEWAQSESPTEIQTLTLIIIALNESNDQEYTKWKNYYLEKFPSGIFKDEISTIKQ